MTRKVSFAAANARRLARHGLVTPLPSLPEAAAAMAGVHAQVMSAAEASLGLRVAGVTRRDVARALWEDRTLVKTYGPRGTVHLLPAADLPWWTRALGAVPSAGGHAPEVRLDPRELTEVVDAIDAALSPGAPLTTEELDDAVGRACGEWAVRRTMPAFGGHWPRWRQALGVAATLGVLCFGPPRGRLVTYASARQWSRAGRRADPHEAVGRLVSAYLTAYGPATPAHLARWLATTPRWAAEAFEEVDLEPVDLAGEPAWVLAGDTDFEAPAAPAVRLLPYFDAFGVGSQPRAMLFPGRAADRALAGSQAGNFPVLLLDGVVGGVWHQKRSGRRVSVRVEPLGTLTRGQRRALDTEADRLGAVLEATTVELSVGPVSVGPHA